MLAVAEIWAPSRLTGPGLARSSAAALAAIGAAAALGGVVWNVSSPTLMVVSFLVASGAFVAAPLVLQWGTGGCWRLLDNRVLRWLGARAYSVYLLHFGVMLTVLPRIEPAGGGSRARRLLAGVVVVAVTLVLADVSYRLIERPFLRLKSGRTARRAALALAAQSPP
jgi:peptidoglycan/LPS O-acetylase OafA/YrhL